MTDPQTPATWDEATEGETRYVRRVYPRAAARIEAEARADDYVTGHRHGVAVGRADALREAAERVHLRAWTLGDGHDIRQEGCRACAAILDPETTP